MTLKNISRLILITAIIIEMAIVHLAEAKSVSPKNWERIITDSEALIDGISIDFSYNESHINANSYGNLSSVPGCPKSDEGYPWVYYGSPKKCYLAGEKGPCEPDQSIFVTLGSPWGYCNCNCFEQGKVNKTNSQDQFCEGLTNAAVYKEFVFKSSLGKCYTIYEQGPCKEDEWLVKTTESRSDVGASQCEKRRCPLNQIPYVDETSNTKCGPRTALRTSPAYILRNQCESYQMKYSKLRKKCVTNFRSGFDF